MLRSTSLPGFSHASTPAGPSGTDHPGTPATSQTAQSAGPALSIRPSARMTARGTQITTGARGFFRSFQLPQKLTRTQEQALRNIDRLSTARSVLNAFQNHGIAGPELNEEVRDALGVGNALAYRYVVKDGKQLLLGYTSTNRQQVIESVHPLTREQMRMILLRNYAARNAADQKFLLAALYADVDSQKATEPVSAIQSTLFGVLENLVDIKRHIRTSAMKDWYGATLSLLDAETAAELVYDDETGQRIRDVATHLASDSDTFHPKQMIALFAVLDLVLARGTRGVGQSPQFLPDAALQKLAMLAASTTASPRDVHNACVLIEENILGASMETLGGLLDRLQAITSPVSKLADLTFQLRLHLGRTIGMKELPPELQARVLGFSPLRDVLAYRRTDKHGADVGASVIKHIQVRSPDELRGVVEEGVLRRGAVEAFSPGGIESLSLNGTFTDADLAFVPASLKSLRFGISVDMSGITDAGMMHLAHLKELKIGPSQQLTDTGLAHLSNVEALIVSDCPNISNAGLAHLANAKKLDLSDNPQITDEGLQHLSGIEDLTLSDCPNITDEGLAHLTNVKRLELSNNEQITDTGLQHLSHVEELVLWGCPNITDDGLAMLTAARKLDLQGNELVTDAGLRHLSQVEEIDLSHGPRISDAGLAALANARKLRLNGNEDITDAGLRHLSRVEELDLSECPNITNAGLACLRNARKLELVDNQRITDSGLRHLSNVSELNLEGCTNITGAGFPFLTNLKSIDLASCINITDQNLVHLRNVDKVVLEGCNQITDNGLAHLAKATFVDVRNCSLITDRGLGHLRNAREVHCDSSSGITKAGVQALRTRHVKVIDFNGAISDDE